MEVYNSLHGVWKSPTTENQKKSNWSWLNKIWLYSLIKWHQRVQRFVAVFNHTLIITIAIEATELYGNGHGFFWVFVLDYGKVILSWQSSIQQIYLKCEKHSLSIWYVNIWEIFPTLFNKRFSLKLPLNHLLIYVSNTASYYISI